MKFLIGVPAYRGQIATQTASTIFNLTKILNHQNHDYHFQTVELARPCRARNILATTFYDGDYDRFISIDDDISIRPEVILRFLDRDYPYAGAFCPQRMLDLGQYSDALLSGKQGADALYTAAPYIGPPLTPAADLNKPTFLKVPYVGTGFFYLRREPLKAILDQGLAKKEISTGPTLNSNIYTFFNIITLEDQTLGEDYSFCERLRRAGIAIHAYLGPGISHIGSMKFST